MLGDNSEGEFAKQAALAYEVLGVSKERAQEILGELDTDELIDRLDRSTLDLREHLGAHHPKENRPWLMASKIRYVLQKHPSVMNRQLIVDGVVRSASEYWSHVTQGHPSPTGSGEEYLISLAQRPQSSAAPTSSRARLRRWWRRG